MAAVTPLEDGRHLNGIVNCILKNGDSIDLSALAQATASSTYTVKIVSLHWTTSGDQTVAGTTDGMVVTYSGGTLNLYGGGAWTRFNGFDGILSSGTAAAGDISVAGDGTLYIAVKKIAGYDTAPVV